MDIYKQVKAKTTFDNIIIYVHAPTAPPSFLALNLLKGKKLNCKFINQKKKTGLIERFFERYPAYKQPPVFKENLTCA